MLRIKLKECIASREFALNRRITLSEVAECTGIHRMTLSKLANHRGARTGTENLDRLCRYFGCAIQDLIEYIPDEQVPSSAYSQRDGGQ